MEGAAAEYPLYVEGDVKEYPCRVRWNLFDPFLPWRNTRATFCHNSPSLLQWRMTVTPTDRGIANWPFLFSLRCFEPGERDFIVARRLKVQISLNGGKWKMKEGNGYCFKRRNRHEFEFKVNTNFRPTTKSDRLTITVDMSIKGRTFRNEGLYWPSLRELSEDLGTLFPGGRYSDLSLLSVNPEVGYPVHSFILQARWSDLLRTHLPHTIKDGTIKTCITEDLLRDILTFVYTGSGAIVEPQSDAYRTEQFQAMERCKLQLLYKVFLPKQRRYQRIETRTEVRKNETRFQLDGKGFSNPIFKWSVNPNTVYELVFRIQFFLSSDPPSFKYTLHPKHSFVLHARVSLTFLWRGRMREEYKMRDWDYEMHPGAPSHFVSHQLDFDSQPYRDFMERERRGENGTEFRHYVKCLLYLSDGSILTDQKFLRHDNLRSFGEDDRWEDLSNCLSELLKRRSLVDLQVVCSGGNQHDPQIHYLHKAIFTARVPNWRNLVREDVPEGEGIPDRVTCDLSSESFEYILDYIYTGMSHMIPDRFQRDAQTFEEVGGLRNVYLGFGTMLYCRRINAMSHRCFVNLAGEIEFRD